MLYKMLDDMLALANSVCLLALSRSDRHVLGLLLCAGLIALCCAVLCLRYYPPPTLAHKEEWSGMTDDVVDGPTFYVQTGDLEMPRAPCSRKTTPMPHACTYILLLR